MPGKNEERALASFLSPINREKSRRLNFIHLFIYLFRCCRPLFCMCWFSWNSCAQLFTPIELFSCLFKWALLLSFFRNSSSFSLIIHYYLFECVHFHVFRNVCKDRTDRRMNDRPDKKRTINKIDTSIIALNVLFIFFSSYSKFHRVLIRLQKQQQTYATSNLRIPYNLCMYECLRIRIGHRILHL